MPRPSQIDEQRKKLLPIVCQTFSELGYRRTTTAALATRCEVRENILYRLWDDKKSMFLAAIEDIFEARAAVWQRLLQDQSSPRQRVDRLVAYESEHQGESGFYRIVFTALVETDDDEIRESLTRMYREFHQLVMGHIQPENGESGDGLAVSDAAWALMGLATISNIILELNLLGPRQRMRMFTAIASQLVGAGGS